MAVEADGLIRWTLRRQWRRVGAGATSGIVWMAGIALAPIIVGDAITGAGWQHMTTRIVALVGVITISALAGAVRHHCAVSLWVNTGLLSEGHLSRRVLDRRGGLDHPAGELVSLGVGDANKIGAVADLTNRGSGAVVTLAGVTIWLLSTSVSLGLLVLLAVPATAAAVLPFLSAYDRRATVERRELADATAAAADGITGLRTAQGLGGGAQVRRWFQERSRRMHEATLALVRMESGLFATVGLLPWFTLIPVLWFGGGQAIDGEISPGTLITVVGLAQFLTTPISTLGEVAQVVTAGRASARRITDVTRASPGIRFNAPGPLPVQSRAALNLVGVESGGLGPLTLRLEDDETLAVVCLRGRDAAELSALLSRHKDPTKGSINLRGRSVDTIPLHELPAHLTVVDTGHPWLLSGSVLDNLHLARSGVSTEDAIDALRSAGADEVVDRNDGLDRPIGERGLRLSGGQRQRVALAQALLADTDVLVIVEPTSALDAATEAEVVRRLAARTLPSTIIVSTSPPVVAGCDRVVFISDGTVAAEGPHDVLVSEAAGYRRLMEVSQ